MKGFTVSTMSSALVSALIAQSSAAQPGALYQGTEYQGREIGNLTGDVYYARYDDYLSAFMVTPDGIVLVEPVGTDQATWLKGELERRFDVPVKFVIYSHFHADHASGGAVYADTATLIGHAAMLDGLAMPPADTALPSNARAQDGNGNGRIEEREAQGRIAALFDAYDENGDGALSGAELARGPLKYVRAPDLTYTERVDIELGGKRVEVIPIPTRHAPDNTIVRFVDGDNVVFASDWITVNRVPFGPVVSLPDEIEKVRRVAGMEFTHFVCSHGRLGTKDDVMANLLYRESLRGRVAGAIAEGLSLEETQQRVTMADYGDWEFYEQQRPLNVMGAYQSLLGAP